MTWLESWTCGQLGSETEWGRAPEIEELATIQVDLHDSSGPALVPAGQGHDCGRGRRHGSGLSARERTLDPRSGPRRLLRRHRRGRVRDTRQVPRRAGRAGTGQRTSKARHLHPDGRNRLTPLLPTRREPRQGRSGHQPSSATLPTSPNPRQPLTTPTQPPVPPHSDASNREAIPSLTPQPTVGYWPKLIS